MRRVSRIGNRSLAAALALLAVAAVSGMAVGTTGKSPDEGEHTHPTAVGVPFEDQPAAGEDARHAIADQRTSAMKKIGINAYISKTQMRCAIVGFLRDGVVVLPDQHGALRPHPLQEGGSCFDSRKGFREAPLVSNVKLLFDQALALETIRDAHENGTRLPGTTVIYGFARADVISIEGRDGDDNVATSPSGPHNAFLIAFDGLREGQPIDLVATLRDGASIRRSVTVQRLPDRQVR